MAQNSLYFCLLPPSVLLRLLSYIKNTVKNPSISHRVILDFYGPLTPDEMSAMEINMRTYLQIFILHIPFCCVAYKEIEETFL